MHDPLQKMLRAADGAASGADHSAPSEFGPKIRAMAALRTRRRQLRTRAAVGLAVLLAVIGGSWWMVQREPVAPIGDQQVVADADQADDASGTDKAQTVVQLRRDLELLRAEREARELALAEMRADRRLQDAERAIRAAPFVDSQLVVVRETERAAARMLLRADDIAARGPNAASEAAAVYAELLEMFPATTSAETARVRLSQPGSGMNPGGDI